MSIRWMSSDAWLNLDVKKKKKEEKKELDQLGRADRVSEWW